MRISIKKEEKYTLILLIILTIITVIAIGFKIRYDNKITEERLTQYKKEEEEQISKLLNIKVAQDGTGDYDTVSEAVEKAIDGSEITIYPGEYYEVIKAYGKNIKLIGIDKEKCIIYNDLDDYYNPPLEISKGYVENLTILSKNSGESSDNSSYAVHIDDNRLYNSKLLFNNCYIYSDNRSGVGIGLRPNSEVVFENCEIVGKYGAGLFFHNSANENYLGDNQNLLVKNSKILSLSGDKALQYQQCYGEENKAYFTSIGSEYLANESKDDVIKILENYEGEGNNIIITNESNGNNINELNKETN